MANFFSNPGNVDMGGNARAAAYSSAGSSIVNAIGQYSAQRNEEEQTKLRARLQEEARQSEMVRQVNEEAATYGVSPVVGSDGKPNVLATKAAILKAKDAHDLVRAQLNRQDDYNFNLKNQADAAGVTPPAQRQLPPVAPGGLFSGKVAAPNIRLLQSGDQSTDQSAATPDPLVMANAQSQSPEMPLARRIKLAQEETERSKRTSDRVATSQGDLLSKAFLLNRPLDATDYAPDGTLIPETANAINDAAAAKNHKEARNATLSTAKEMVASEQPDLKPDSPEYKAALDRKLTYMTAPAPVKTGILNAQGLEDTGLIQKGDNKAFMKEAMRFASFGGSAPTLTPGMQSAVSDRNTLLQGQQDIMKRIDDFNARHPEGFDSYVGPIDNKTLQYNLKMNSGASDGSKEAARILGQWQSLANKSLKDISGAAVTESEFKRFMQASGDPSNANFVNALRGWHDSTAGQFQNQLNSLNTYNVPDSLKTVNGKSPGEWVGAWSAKTPAAAATAPVASNDLASLAAAEIARRRGGK